MSNPHNNCVRLSYSLFAVRQLRLRELSDSPKSCSKLRSRLTPLHPPPDVWVQSPAPPPGPHCLSSGLLNPVHWRMAQPSHKAPCTSAVRNWGVVSDLAAEEKLLVYPQRESSSWPTLRAHPASQTSPKQSSQLSGWRPGEETAMWEVWYPGPSSCLKFFACCLNSPQ